MTTHDPLDNLTLVYKNTGKSVPFRYYRKLLERPPDHERFEVICKGCQRVRKSEERLLKRKEI